MTDTCGCCEGTQLLTPQPVANRPGLDTLSYRVGTHAAFLETMKARLSNFRFDTPPGESDAANWPQLPPPLHGLTTRAADDPAIALMDAWATVADVLTFYQERIANEGYLRTATERRSILELARLVGYALRPGVASTVFLAYTLDENAKDPVIIPRGARAQSVPGPGETPQSFETIEEIEARAAWNLLKPRMARPQTRDSISDSKGSCASPRVFLQGIGTNLKPNDPLLIQFGADTPVFVRVKDVQPDALADRTLVTLQSGPDCRKATTATEVKTSPETITADAKQQLGGIVARYLGEEVKARELSRGTKMFGKASELLTALEKQLVEAVPYPALLALLNDETLPGLETEHETAEKNRDRYTNLEPWLTDLIAELRRVAATTSSARAEALAREFTLAAQPAVETTGSTVVADPFAALPTGLETPPSIPPRNALALDRDLSRAFQGRADTLLNALGALRPDLREVLSTVAANTKVAQDVAIKVYALRVTAAPFGHNSQPVVARFVAQPASGNAPLTVHFTSLSGGDITSYNWDFGDGTSSISRDPNHTYTQSNTYSVTLRVRGPAGTAQAQMGVQVGTLQASFTPSLTTGSAPLQVQFTDSSSGQPRAWAWNFGDGSAIDNSQNPTHTFGNDGNYTVILTITDVQGKESEASRTITVGTIINIIGQPVAIAAPLPSVVSQVAVIPLDDLSPHEKTVLFLDADYNISPESWIVIAGKQEPPLVVWLDTNSVGHESLAAFGINSKSTRLTLGKEWFADPLTMEQLRSTIVYALSEELSLAQEPLDNPLCTSNDPASPTGWIELDDLYSGLQAGRWLIVEGERTDVVAPDPNGGYVSIPGIHASELVMLSEVTQSVEETSQQSAYGYAYGYEYGGKAPAPGEKTHTYIRLATDLALCYRRDTVRIYGNVVKATHGETRQEVLGSGDGSTAFQTFTLKQPPLTYMAAVTPSGAESTLHVRVNGVEWHEAGSLADQGPTDRSFITRTDDDGKTTVVFGDGRQGARPPTGVENIKAVYRAGIGQAGNVKPGQISQLVTRPLGVKEVVNPQRASGGADRESRDQARKNAPLAVMALDRLVSTQDYADFARTFAGIGKASAVRLSHGRRQLVHVTIAGANDIPIDKTPDLYGSLVKALRHFGDSHQAIQVDVRELMLIVLSANVRLLPDYQWESVVPKVRARLLDAFSFERRELGQDVLLSEIISTIQAVEGVAYVDVDKLRGVAERDANGQLLTPEAISASVLHPIPDPKDKEKTLPEPLSRLSVNMAGVTNDVIRPAQLAFLTPDVEATLILNEVKA